MVEFVLRVLHKAEIVLFLDRRWLVVPASASALILKYFRVDASVRVRVEVCRCEDALSIGHHHGVAGLGCLAPVRVARSVRIGRGRVSHDEVYNAPAIYYSTDLLLLLLEELLCLSLALEHSLGHLLPLSELLVSFITCLA